MVAQEWKQVQGIAPDLLLPGVHEQMRKTMVAGRDEEAWILSAYVLEPLLDFGLIAVKKKDDWPGVSENDAIRISSLWGKFIRFERPVINEPAVWN